MQFHNDASRQGEISANDRAEWYRIIAEHTSDTIVLVDKEAVVRFVSPSFQSTSGYSLNEYEGADAFDVIHPDDRDRVRQAQLDVIATKSPVDLEYRVIHADGRLIHVETRVKPVLDANGDVHCVVAVARDVTRRKQAEELLENILHNVGAAVWSSDRDFTRYTYCSESIQDITGIPREEVMDRPIRLHDHIHSEDNAALMGDIKRKLDMGQPVQQPIRFTHVKGEERWVQLTIHPWTNRLGEVERLDGIMTDITERMRIERAREESEQRYKSLFEHNLDGVFSIELSGFYLVNANPAFEAMTGVELAKLTGRCFLGVVYDEDHPTVYEALFDVMRNGRPRDVECRLAAGASGERIVHITFVPILLSGKLNGIHGIVQDITRRKQEERELIQSEQRSKFLQQSLNRLSHDLANVMKVSVLESRLLEEVRAVLNAAEASIEEVPRGQAAQPPEEGVVRIKIGEKKDPVYLRIALTEPLGKAEEEWLETAVHYATLVYDNLHLIEDLMNRLEESVAARETPRWMLRLLFNLSEKERATLSSDLHDSVLQDLIIWYRKLESLRSLRKFEPETERDLRQVEEGLLDAIHQIRITCNELRPPFLLKMGLVESLKSLFEYTRMFANYEIEFAADALSGELEEEQVLGMYRIVQELLNNANKHSKASSVRMTLRNDGDAIVFTYADDGVGMDLSGLEGSFRHMGIAGIEKRVQSLEGDVEFESAPGQGFRVRVKFPK